MNPSKLETLASKDNKAFYGICRVLQGKYKDFQASSSSLHLSAVDFKHDDLAREIFRHPSPFMLTFRAQCISESCIKINIF